MIRFLKLFTELELTEIEEMAGQLATETGPTYVNSLKRRLADECTTLLHGADCLPAIHETADSLFKNKGGSLADLPRVEVAEDSISVVDALIAAEFAKSKGEARRLIKGGGARVDGVKVEDVEREVALAGAEVPLVGEEEARAARGEVREVYQSCNCARTREGLFGFFLFSALIWQPYWQPCGQGRQKWSLPNSWRRRWWRWSGSARSRRLTSSMGRSALPAGCLRSPPRVRHGSRSRHRNERVGAARARRAWRSAGAARRSTRRARTGPRQRSGRGRRS